MSTPSDPARAATASRSVLEEPAPVFSTMQAEEVGRQVFDLHASAHPLESERDQNFRLSAKDGSEWVLKIANPAEDPDLLDMHTARAGDSAYPWENGYRRSALSRRLSTAEVFGRLSF